MYTKETSSSSNDVLRNNTSMYRSLSGISTTDILIWEIPAYKRTNSGETREAIEVPAHKADQCSRCSGMALLSRDFLHVLASAKFLDHHLLLIMISREGIKSARHFGRLILISVLGSYLVRNFLGYELET